MKNKRWKLLCVLFLALACISMSACQIAGAPKENKEPPIEKEEKNNQTANETNELLPEEPMEAEEDEVPEAGEEELPEDREDNLSDTEEDGIMDVPEEDGADSTDAQDGSGSE